MIMISGNKDYIEKHERGLITAIRNDTGNTIDDRMKITRKQKWWKKTNLWPLLTTNKHHLTRENLDLAKGKKNLKLVTESLLIAAQANAIRTNHINARIDKTQLNSKCRLCGDRERNDQSHNKRMQQISTEGVLDETRLGRQGDQLEDLQEI